MILCLFDHLFNPLTITSICQIKNDVRIYFDSETYVIVFNAQAYDVAATINQAIKDFHDNKT
jgi:hypothetical protein